MPGVIWGTECAMDRPKSAHTSQAPSFFQPCFLEFKQIIFMVARMFLIHKGMQMMLLIHSLNSPTTSKTPGNGLFEIQSFYLHTITDTRRIKSGP